MDRLYCTVQELQEDLQWEDHGPKSTLILRAIRSASQHVDRRIGQFIPVTQIRYYTGLGKSKLSIDPIVSLTSLTDDGDAITNTQYLTFPRNCHWENGPYTQLVVDPDATELNVWTAEIDSVVITGLWGLYNVTELTGATVQNTTKIATADTELEVETDSDLTTGMVLLIESEQLLVTARSEERKYTVKRGVNGTIAADHVTDTVVSRYVPPYDVNWFTRQTAGLMLKKAESNFAGKVGNVDLGEVYYFDEFPKKLIAEIKRNYRLVRL